jgi:hypothetical protein
MRYVKFTEAVGNDMLDAAVGLQEWLTDHTPGIDIKKPMALVDRLLEALKYQVECVYEKGDNE